MISDPRAHARRCPIRFIHPHTYVRASRARARAYIRSIHTHRQAGRDRRYVPRLALHLSPISPCRLARKRSRRRRRRRLRRRPRGPRESRGGQTSKGRLGRVASRRARRGQGHFLLEPKSHRPSGRTGAFFTHE